MGKADGAAEFAVGPKVGPSEGAVVGLLDTVGSSDGVEEGCCDKVGSSDG